MSDSVDRNVVEMRFDNKQFEENAKQTMSTLDKLEEKLNFKDASNGIDNINDSVKKVSFSPMTSAIDQIQVKFSMLEVIATTALANITNSAVNAGKNLVKSLSVDQITEGWTKYEQKSASVQTIMNSTGKSISEVNEYLDRLMWFSDETSYGFTDMTAALSQMTSSGGDIENLIPLITGVANATAFAGKGANEFSRAMFNLNQSYGAGHLQLTDWKSLELAGVSSKQLKETFIQIGEELGKIQKGSVTIGNFSETLKDKWADTEVMEKAFGKFSELSEEAYKLVKSGEYDTAAEAMESLSGKYSDLAEKAFKSAQEAKSFTDAINATKDAVSSGWMNTAEIIFGNFEEAKVLWTDVCESLWDIFASGGEERNSILSQAFDFGGDTKIFSDWKKLSKTISSAGISVNDFQKVLSATAKEHGISLEELISKYGSLEGAIQSGKITFGMISDSIKKLIGIGEKASNVTGEITDKVKYFNDIVGKVINGDFGNGVKRVEALTEAGYDAVQVQSLVNKIWERNGKTWNNCTLSAEELSDVIGDMSDEELKGIGYTEEQIKALKGLNQEFEKPSGRQLFSESITNALQGITKLLNTLKKAWNEIFHPGETDEEIMKKKADSIYSLLEAIHTFSKTINFNEEVADKLKRTFKGLFAVLDTIRIIVSGTLKAAFKVLSTIFGTLDINALDVTADIGDAAVALRDFVRDNREIAEVFSTAVDWISKECVQIKEWINALFALPEANNFVLNFGNSTTKVLSGVGKYFEGGKTVIHDFIERVKSLDHITVDNISDVLKDFSDNVLGYFFNIEGGIGGLEGKLKTLKSTIGTYFTDAYNCMSNTGKKVVEFFDAFNSKYGKNILGGLIITGFAVAIIKFSKEIAKAFDSLKGIEKAVVGVLNSASGALQAYSKSLKSDNLLKIAAAIGILVASIALLSHIPIDDLIKSCIAITVMAGALLALSGIEPVIPKTSSAMILFAGGIMILAIALKKMEDLDTTKITGNLKTMAILASELVGAMTILTVVSALFSKSSANLKGTAHVLIAFSSSLWIMVKTLDALSKVKTDNIGIQLLAIATLLGGMVIVISASKDVDYKSVLALIAITEAFAIFVKSFMKILKVGLEELVEGVGKLIIIVALFKILMKATKSAGEYAAKGGAAVLLMSAGMIVLGQAFKILSDITDAKMISKSMLCISGMLLVFGAIVALSYFAGENAVKAGVMILLMSGAIAILAGVMWGLSLIAIDNEGFDKALGAILAIEGMFAVIVGISKLATDCQKTLITMTVAISIMSLALGLLAGFCDGGELMQVSTSISMIMVSMILMMALSKLTGNATTGMLGTVLVFGIVAVVLEYLSSMNVTNSIETAVSLSVLMIALSAAMAIMGLAKDVSMKAIGALAIMAIITAGLGALLGYLSSMDMTVSIETAVSLSVLMIALSASCLILAALGPLAEAAIIGALAFAGVILILTILMVGLGALAETCYGMDEALDDAITVLEKIGEGIGAFVGGVLAGLAAGLPSFAQYISSFISILVSGINQLGSLDKGILDSALTLSKVILAITAADLLNNITAFLPFVGTFNSLGSGLSNFGEAMISFGKKMEALTPAQITAIEDSSTAAGYLVALCKTFPKDGGWAQAITGHQNWTTFGAGLANFGRVLVIYSSAVSLLTPEDLGYIKRSSDATSYLVALCKTFPTDGGWTQVITGHKNWTTFGTGLAEFGGILVSYSSAVSLLTPEDLGYIKRSSDAAGILVDLCKTLPKDAGLWQAITGYKDWTTFGTGLETFGGILVRYGNTVADVDSTSIAHSVISMNSLNKVLLAMPDTCAKNWTSFSDGLLVMGDTLKTYSEKVVDVNYSSVAISASSMIKLTTVLNGLPDDTKDRAKNFAASIEPLGKGISKYAKSIESLNFSDMTSCEAHLTKLIEILKSAGDFNPSNVAKLNAGIQSLGSINLNKLPIDFEPMFAKLKMVGSDVIQNLIDGFNSRTKDVNKSIIDIIKSSGNQIISSIGNICDAIINYTAVIAPDLNSAFNRMGSFTVKSLINGISSQKREAELAMKSIANGIKDSYRNTMRKTENGLISETNSFKNQFSNEGTVLGNALGGKLYSSLSSSDYTFNNFVTKESKKVTEERKKVSNSPRHIQKKSDTANEVNMKKSDIVNKVNEKKSEIIDKVKNGGSEINDEVKDSGSEIFNNISSWAEEKYSEAHNVIKEKGSEYLSSNGITDILFGNYDSFIGQFGDVGLDVGNIFGNGMYDGITTSSDYALDTLDDNSYKLLTKAEKEYDILLENYKNGKITQAKYDEEYTKLLKKYTTVQTDLTKYVCDKLLPIAEKEYDNLLENYKNGKITQAKYDEEYTNLLKKYTAVQIDLAKYGQSEIAKYVEDTFKDLNTEFEKEIDDIQKKMDDFSNKMTTPINEMLTFTTNKDIYEKKIGEYDKQIESLNEKREQAIKTYGEESRYAANLQTEIDKLTESRDQYKKTYEKSGLKDDEIVDVRFTNKIKQSTRDAEEYTDAIKKLENRKVELNPAMVAAIADMSQKEGLATVNYLNNLTDKELAAVSHNWDKYTNATAELSKALYSDELKKTTETYVENVVTTLDTLPGSAKKIGMDTALGLALGFSEETEKSLASIGLSGESITNYLKKLFGIHSPSRVFKDEIGSNLAAGLVEGFIEKMLSLSPQMKLAVPTDFKMDDIDTSSVKAFSGIIGKISDAIKGGMDIQPTITPVLDLTNVNNGLKTINGKYGLNMAVQTSSGFENNRSNGIIGPNGTSVTSGFTFNQYNTSPKSLSRAEIHRDTMNGLQLARTLI